MSKVQNRERALRKLAEMPKAVRRALAPAIEQGAAEIVDMQKRLAPEDSGDLKNSIRYVKGTYTPDNANVRGVGTSGAGDPDLTVHVVAGDASAWYARIVEFGSAPHQIKPKRAGGILKIGNRFAARANHPGAKATPFFYPAYRSLRRRVKARITRAAKKGIKEAAGS